MLHLLLQEEIASFCPNLRERDDVDSVLDVACGPGWWVLAMAQEHRDVNFVGIDRSTSFIQFARTMIRAREMENALFHVQDIYSPDEVLLPSGGARAHHRFFRQASVACLQMRAFLLAMEVTTVHEFEQLYRQIHVDMLSKAFRGTCVVKMVYGKRAR